MRFFGLFVLVSVALALTGCSGALILLGINLAADSSSSGGVQLVPREETAVSSATPRQCAVVGGVEVVLKGKNFEPDMLLSFAGVDTKFQFLDEETVVAVVPFNDLNPGLANRNNRLAVSASGAAFFRFTGLTLERIVSAFSQAAASVFAIIGRNDNW